MIEEDRANIRKVCFRGKTPSTEERPLFIATAETGGNCKSTILEGFLQEIPNIVYLDADQRSLKYMINTYRQDMTHLKYSQDGFEVTAMNAYKRWAPGSTYISSSLLNEAFEERYNIAHGTTSTGDHVEGMYVNLRAANYKIILLLCYSSAESRHEATEHRAKTQDFVQATPQNLREKALLFPRRVPIYFEHADVIHLYWTDHFLQGSTLAATFEREKGLQVLNQDSLAKFTAQYNMEREGTDLAPLETCYGGGSTSKH